MCLPAFQRNLLPQYRSADAAEIKVSTCKTPHCCKVDHHILNFRRFEKPKAHSYFFLFTAGIGYGQMFATLMVLLYYCSLIALSGVYLVNSFAYTLPWYSCFEEWEEEDICYPSGRTAERTIIENRTSSSELYF